jgi:hypothetical protein
MIQVKRWGIGLTMLAVAVLLITQKLHPAGGADVTTDKHMYHQGETMAITGVGFLPAHAISRTVQRPDKVIETVPNVFRCIGSDSGRVCASWLESAGGPCAEQLRAHGAWKQRFRRSES